MTPKKPKFKPTTPEAERLEEVREVFRVPLVRFREQLIEDGTFTIAYESVRKYHRGADTTPAAYYVRVAEVFGVSLEWLLLGHGPMWARDLGRVREVGEGMREILPKKVPGFFKLASSAAISAMQHTFQKVLRSLPSGEAADLTPEEVAELAARLIRLAEEPSRRVFHRNAPSYENVTIYYQNIFQAMAIATPGDLKGKSFNDLMATLEPWATQEEDAPE